MSKETKVEHDFWGNEKHVHYEDGHKVGETREETSFFGGSRDVTRDNDGNVVSTSRNETSFFGGDRTVSRDTDGNFISSTRTESTGIFSSAGVVRDSDGSKIAELSHEKDFWGNDRVVARDSYGRDIDLNTRGDRGTGGGSSYSGRGYSGGGSGSYAGHSQGSFWPGLGLLAAMALFIGIGMHNGNVKTETVRRNNFIASANTYFERGDYAHAAELFRRAKDIRSLPDISDHQFFERFGFSLLKINDPEGAIKEYDTALKLEPRNSKSWLYRGEALDQVGRINAADSSYGNSLSIDIKEAEAWKQKALTLRKLYGDEYASFAMLERSVELDPSDKYVWYQRAVALNNVGRLEDALASIDSALVIDPNFVMGSNMRSKLRKQLGMPQYVDTKKTVILSGALEEDNMDARIDLDDLIVDVPFSLDVTPRRLNVSSNYQLDRLVTSMFKVDNVDSLGATEWKRIARKLTNSGDYSAALRCLDRAIDLRIKRGIPTNRERLDIYEIVNTFSAEEIGISTETYQRYWAEARVKDF